ncbi:MAG: ATP-binding protein [Bacteroidota bacterium]
MIKRTSLAFNDAFKKHFRSEERSDYRLLFFALFIPLTCMLFLLEWKPQILIFIFLGYTSAVIGFLLARTTLVRDQLLSEADKLYRLMVNYIDDVVIVHRMEDHSNVFVSPSIAGVLGFSPDEIICKYGTFLIHPGDRKKLIQHLKMEALEKNPSFTKMLRVQKKDGQYIWMELNGKAITDPESGVIVYTIWSFRDATERREIETATRYFAEELMRKNEQNKVLLPEGSYMNNMMASHDLKEPLLTMCSYINLIDQKYKHQLDLAGRECVEYIKDGAQRMNHMLDDVLTFSSMSKDTLKLTKTDSKKLLDEVLVELGPKIAQSNALISCENLPVINVDARQFQRLLYNLIDNAIKYSGKAHPLIEIYWQKKEGYWQFSVRDNGIGIPQAFQEQVFDMFRRLHSVSDFEGSGIGLTICQRIVANHGGKIWIESTPQEVGATFHFTIPVHMRTMNRMTKSRTNANNLLKQYP